MINQKEIMKIAEILSIGNPKEYFPFKSVVINLADYFKLKGKKREQFLKKADAE